MKRCIFILIFFVFFQLGTVFSFASSFCFEDLSGMFKLGYSARVLDQGGKVVFLEDLETASLVIESSGQNEYVITGIRSKAWPLWIVLDKNGVEMSKSRHQDKVDGKTIVVPQNGKLILNVRKNDFHFVKRVLSECPGLNTEYELVFQDDFNILDSSVWGNVRKKSSLYLSDFGASSENCSVENGVLKMSMKKKDGQLLGPYLSTAESFAIREGRIEARIRVESETRGSCLWCFWSFGQNAPWPQTIEYDVIEQSQRFLGINTHYESNRIHRTLKSGFEGQISQWHTFAVEWNEHLAMYLIDGVTKEIVPLNKMGVKGNVYPQDIRMNVKSNNELQDHCVLLIDWIKVFAPFHNSNVVSMPDTITIEKGEIFYANFFNDKSVNQAFFLKSLDESVVIVNSEKYRFGPVVHSIVGKREGFFQLNVRFKEGVTKNVVVHVK